MDNLLALRPITNKGRYVGSVAFETPHRILHSEVPDNYIWNSITLSLQQLTITTEYYNQIKPAINEQEYYYDYGNKTQLFDGIVSVPPSEIFKLERLRILDTEFIEDTFKNFIGQVEYDIVQELFTDYFSDYNSDSAAFIKVWVSKAFGNDVYFHFNSALHGKNGEFIGLSTEEYIEISTDEEEVNAALLYQIKKVVNKYKNVTGSDGNPVSLSMILSKVYAFTQFWLSIKYSKNPILDCYTALPNKFVKNNVINTKYHLFTDNTQVITLDPFIVKSASDSSSDLIVKMQVYRECVLVSEDMILSQHTIKRNNNFGLNSLIIVHPENFALVELVDIPIDDKKVKFNLTIKDIFNYVGFSFLHQFIERELDKDQDFLPDINNISNIINQVFKNSLTAKLTAEKLSNQISAYARIYNFKTLCVNAGISEDIVNNIVVSRKVDFNKGHSFDYIKNTFNLDTNTTQIIVNNLGIASNILPRLSSVNERQTYKIPENYETGFLRKKITEHPYCNAFTFDENLVDLTTEENSKYLITTDKETYVKLKNQVYEIISDDKIITNDALALYTFQKLFSYIPELRISKKELENLQSRVYKVDEYRIITFGSSFIILDYLSVEEFGKLDAILNELPKNNYNQFTVYKLEETFNYKTATINAFIQNLKPIVDDYQKISNIFAYSQAISKYESLRDLIKPDLIEVEILQIGGKKQKIKLTPTEVKTALFEANQVNKKYQINSIAAKLRYDYLNQVHDVFRYLLNLATIDIYKISQISKLKVKDYNIYLPLYFNYDVPGVDTINFAYININDDDEKLYIDYLVGLNILKKFDNLKDYETLKNMNLLDINKNMELPSFMLLINKTIIEHTLQGFNTAKLNRLKESLSIFYEVINIYNTSSIYEVSNNIISTLVYVKDTLGKKAKGEADFKSLNNYVSAYNLSRFLDLLTALLKDKPSFNIIDNNVDNVNNDSKYRTSSGVLSYSKYVNRINELLAQIYLNDHFISMVVYNLPYLFANCIDLKYTAKNDPESMYILYKPYKEFAIVVSDR